MTDADGFGPRASAEPDDDLRSLLSEWRLAVPEELDRCLLAAYRTRFGRQTMWERTWNRKVAIPVPLLACVLLALTLGLGLRLVRRGTLAARRTQPEPALLHVVVEARSLEGYRPIRGPEGRASGLESGR